MLVLGGYYYTILYNQIMDYNTNLIIILLIEFSLG